MTKCNLNPLWKLDKEYGKSVCDVKAAYICEWDDEIHESYSRYVNALQKNASEIHSIRCEMDIIYDETEEFGIDELINRAESLCMEAMSVC